MIVSCLLLMINNIQQKTLIIVFKTKSENVKLEDLEKGQGPMYLQSGEGVCGQPLHDYSRFMRAT